MCLIVFAYRAHPSYKLIVAANRDEFYSRPTAVAHWWKDHPTILGGRDMEAHGTWMAINTKGRFAAVTNFRDIKNIKQDARSRGDLPVHFLRSDDSALAYSEDIQRKGSIYNGFNLLTFSEEAAHVSNYDQSINQLAPGIYGLSNALLDTPWPKVVRAKHGFNRIIQEKFELTDLIAMMQNTDTAKDDQLPDTGLDHDTEKALSAMCIRMPGYGTCCSTAITIDHADQVRFMEKSYAVGDREEGIASFQFKIEKDD